MTPKYIWMRPLMGIILSVCLVALTGYITWKVFALGWEAIPEAVKLVWVAMIQAIIVMTTGSHGFYFGSSQGSANKAQTLDKVALNGMTSTGSGEPTEVSTGIINATR